MNFTDMNLKPEIQKSLVEIGFLTPTPIQEKIIPIILEQDRDIIGLAQTGTGKTAAFGLPVLQKIDPSQSFTQALIMAPTRELTVQIATDLNSLARYMKKVNIAMAYGGAPIDKQIKALSKGAQIIVATPGRLLDLIKRKKIQLAKIRILVLDEADEMLTVGFKEDIDSILAGAPAEKTTLLFSATMSSDVAKIASKYMVNPREVSTGSKNTGAANIDYRYYVVQAKNRYPAMKRIIDLNPDIYAMIFCRTRQETKDIAEKLIKDGYDADAIHGELSQVQRNQVMKRFKDKSLKLLVATDVASRGLDVKDITHVINYNLPDEVEIYTHRSGRTGRAGKNGVAIAIIHAREARRLRRIQASIGRTFDYHRVPTPAEIHGSRIENFVASFNNDNSKTRVNPKLLEKAVEGLAHLSKEELIEKLLKAEISEVSKKNVAGDDLNVPFAGLDDAVRGERNKDERPARRKKEKKPRLAETKSPVEQKKKKKEKKEKKEKKVKDSRPQTKKGRCRFFLNSGSKFGLTSEALKAFVKDRASVSDLHSIEIMKRFAFFEVDDSQADKVLAGLSSTELDGRPVSAKIAIPPGE